MFQGGKMHLLRPYRCVMCVRIAMSVQGTELLSFGGHSAPRSITCRREYGLLILTCTFFMFMNPSASVIDASDDTGEKHLLEIVSNGQTLRECFFCAGIETAVALCHPIPRKKKRVVRLVQVEWSSSEKKEVIKMQNMSA